MVSMLFVCACALQILSTGNNVQKRQEKETKENQQKKMKNLFQTLNDPEKIHSYIFNESSAIELDLKVVKVFVYHLKLY